MRKTVPLSSVVPVLRFPASSSPVLSTGKPSVVHTTQAVAPGRDETRFFATSSILTTARPDASWPVTTRRICSAINALLGCGCHGRHDLFPRLEKSATILTHAAARPIDRLPRRSHQL